MRPILDGLVDDRFGAEGTYTIVQCSGCDLIQTVPRLGGDKLKALYEAHYNFGGSDKSLYTRFREALFQSLLYRFWLAIDGDISFHTVRGTGRLLDIGCNEGRGLLRYAANGFTVEGMELNECAAASARRLGFTIHSETLDRFHPEQPYDAVILSNVLEHVADPVELLQHISRILKPGGRLYVSCPNVNSWQKTIFGKHWINWHVPFHIIHFSDQTLTQALEKGGFRIVTSRHCSPALWTAQSTIAKLFSQPGKPTQQLRNTFLVIGLMSLIRGITPFALWLGNRLKKGDCLVFQAEKMIDENTDSRH